jgi:hypothetical protein
MLRNTYHFECVKLTNLKGYPVLASDVDDINYDCPLAERVGRDEARQLLSNFWYEYTGIDETLNKLGFKQEGK